MISLKFIPLSFITSNDEVIKQIKNTVVFSHLFEKCKETTLSNYIETTQYGFTASALEKGSHRLLRITDINHGKVNWENVPFCGCNDDGKYLLKDNDILVARTGGTTGKSFLVNNPPSNAVFASYLIRIRLKKDVNIEFINAFLNSYCFWSQIIEMKSGSAQPNVNAEKLKELVIPDCDSETQAKVIRLLKEENLSDSIREKIDSVENLFWNNNQITTELSHQLELVRQLRQAFLREAMQGKLVEQDYTDEPAEILLKRIKAEKEKLVAEKKIKQGKIQEPETQEELLFDIPSNWTWCLLDDICIYITDGTHQTPTYTKSGRIFLSAQNVKPFRFMPEQHQFVSEEAYADYIRNRKAEKGDLLVARVGAGIGETAVIDRDIDFAFYVSLGLVKPFKQFVNSEYLAIVFNSPYGVKYSKGNISSKGGSAGNFNLGRIRSFLIPLPPLAEQKRIVEKLEKLMAFCDELEANIRESKTQAETLLQVALKEALETR